MSITDWTFYPGATPQPQVTNLRAGVPILSNFLHNMKVQTDMLYTKTGPRRSVCFPEPDYSPLATATAAATYVNFLLGATACTFQMPVYIPPQMNRLYLAADIGIGDQSVNWVARFKLKTLINAQTERESAGVQCTPIGHDSFLQMWETGASGVGGQRYTPRRVNFFAMDLDVNTINASDRIVIIEPSIKFELPSIEYINTTVTRYARLRMFTLVVGADYIL